MELNDKKKEKTAEKKEEETSLLLSMVDINILQNIFIDLVEYEKIQEFKGFKYSRYEQGMKKSIALLLNFCLSCKLFFRISKQPLFPLILNNININLNYKKYLQILFIKQKVQKDNCYQKKNINTIFYESCRSGYFEIITTLIKYEPNINNRQHFDKLTPLIITISFGNFKTCKKLIEFKNLNINQQSKDKRTPLIYACFSGKEDMVKLLIARKDIDINIIDSYGKTAMDWAKEKKYENIIKILQNYDQN